ncbi:cytochrome P450 4V2-like [Rhodnius prolixus]|uniref:cytochrome P450 4V2-like n=1 Tax=Rhodnius prolixus TaxID=13249 RepID=UPI003D18BD57
MIAIIVITLVVLVVAYFLITATYRSLRAFRMVEGIPSLPSPVPLLGHSKLFYSLKSNSDFVELTSPVLKTAPVKMCKSWFGPKIIITVLEPKYIQTILSSKDALDKDSIYNILQTGGSGVFNQNGKTWHELRKPLDKFMNIKLIENYFDNYQKSAVQICDSIGYYANTGEYIDLRHWMGNFTMDVLSGAIFGYETKLALSKDCSIGKKTEHLISLAMKLIFKPHLMVCQALLPLCEDGREYLNGAKEFWLFVGDILRGRINQIGSSEDFKPKFYSDILIQRAEKAGLSHQELSRLATDLIIAGFDAPALITASVIMMLAMFPEHEEAVYREQMEIIGEDLSIMPSWNDFSKMHYLNRVLKETIRIFCPIGIVRYLKKDIKLDDKFTLPQGCSTYLSFYDLHRDPKYWSHPHDFHPDHFLPEEVARRPKGTYLPFSWGPRSCPGTQFANVTIKVILSRLIREFKFLTDLKFEELRFKYALFLEPENGFLMKIQRRIQSSNMS